MRQARGAEVLRVHELTQLPQLEGENKFFAGMGFGNT
jgi:hypothetical protein